LKPRRSMVCWKALPTWSYMTMPVAHSTASRMDLARFF
jgi:hypothetical protein